MLLYIRVAELIKSYIHIFMPGTKVFIGCQIQSGSLPWPYYGPNFTGSILLDFCSNLRAVQMSSSFFIHLSFKFCRYCNPNFTKCLWIFDWFASLKNVPKHSLPSPQTFPIRWSGSSSYNRRENMRIGALSSKLKFWQRITIKFKAAFWT